MYIAKIPNRGSPPAFLLRESYRQGGKVKTRTIANLSKLSPAQIEILQRVLRGQILVPAQDGFEIIRSRPHGHVAAVLGTIRRLGFHTMLSTKRSQERQLALALVVARIIDPGSKLATARGLQNETLTSSLCEVLKLGSVDEDDLYKAMDWLHKRQSSIEGQLAKRHLHNGTLVFYDVTSTYFEGRTCPLAKIGHSRDGKKGTLQVVFGLLCEPEGRPVAVEVFEGNTGDPTTLSTQIEKIRQRFQLDRVVFVGDRGMITDARIREELRPVKGLDWLTTLRSPQIRKLVESGTLQLSLFDEQDLAEIRHPDFPDERLIACRNPLLAVERARKRNEMLADTEQKLEQIRSATERSRRPLRGKDKIGVRVGRVLAKSKVGKHFQYTITETGFHCRRNDESIAREAALDGLYVVRTSVPSETLSSEKSVEAYKRLSVVERLFRSCKTVDLEVRPIYHRKADRVRSHIFLCMLAYYVEWHMRKALAPMLFDDHDKATAEAQRESVVQPAQRSPSALRKARTKHTEDDSPVHSFQSLLRDLATIVKNRVQSKSIDSLEYDKVTTPTVLQQKAFDLLGVDLMV